MNIELTDSEMSRLIREAPPAAGIRVRTAPLDIAFGPGWAALRDVPENQWAVDLVKKWRTAETSSARDE